MRVLIVDDSLTIRRKAAEVLESQGYLCDFAENGLEGIRNALRQRYDLIIADINMPLLDGLKFIQRVRANEKGRDIPILILSGRGDHEAVLRAKQLGVQSYVLKPLQPDTLLQRVQALLK